MDTDTNTDTTTSTSTPAAAIATQNSNLLRIQTIENNLDTLSQQLVTKYTDYRALVQKSLLVEASTTTEYHESMGQLMRNLFRALNIPIGHPYSSESLYSRAQSRINASSRRIFDGILRDSLSVEILGKGMVQLGPSADPCNLHCRCNHSSGCKEKTLQKTLTPREIYYTLCPKHTKSITCACTSTSCCQGPKHPIFRNKYDDIDVWVRLVINRGLSICTSCDTKCARVCAKLSCENNRWNTKTKLCKAHHILRTTQKYEPIACTGGNHTISPTTSTHPWATVVQDYFRNREPGNRHAYTCYSCRCKANTQLNSFNDVSLKHGVDSQEQDEQDKSDDELADQLDAIVYSALGALGDNDDNTESEEEANKEVSESNDEEKEVSESESKDEEEVVEEDANGNAEEEIGNGTFPPKWAAGRYKMELVLMHGRLFYKIAVVGDGHCFYYTLLLNLIYIVHKDDVQRIREAGFRKYVQGLRAIKSPFRNSRGEAVRTDEEHVKRLKCELLKGLERLIDESESESESSKRKLRDTKREFVFNNVVIEKRSIPVKDLLPADFNGEWADFGSFYILSALLGNDFAVHNLNLPRRTKVKVTKSKRHRYDNLTESYHTYVNFDIVKMGCFPRRDENDKSLFRVEVQSLETMLEYRRQMRGTLCHMFILYVNGNHYDLLVPASIHHERFRALRQPNQSDDLTAATNATKSEIVCVEQYYAGCQPMASVQYDLPSNVTANTQLKYTGPAFAEAPRLSVDMSGLSTDEDDDKTQNLKKQTQKRKKVKGLTKKKQAQQIQAAMDEVYGVFVEEPRSKRKRLRQGSPPPPKSKPTKPPPPPPKSKPTTESKLFTKQSNITNAGIGLFTGTKIAKNSHICNMGGVLLDDKEFEALEIAEREYGVRIQENLILSAHNEKTHLGRFANTNPGKNNARLVVDRKNKTVSLRSTTCIEKNGEVYIPYGRAFWKYIRDKLGLSSSSSPPTPIEVKYKCEVE